MVCAFVCEIEPSSPDIGSRESRNRTQIYEIAKKKDIPARDG
jgi:hypothetical protein